MTCERCLWDRIKGERFCTSCKRQVMREMRESGYLRSVNLKRPYRGGDAREKIVETCYGVNSGSHDNAVRALEGD